MALYPEEFGARGDGRADDTAAVQKALDACAVNGGTVELSAGKTYLCGSLFIGDRTELRLAHGSVLLASPRLEDYFRPDSPGAADASRVGNPVVGKPSYVFLYAYGRRDIRVTGSGVIDGNGSSFVRRVDRYYRDGDFYPRPTLVYFENCEHVGILETVFRGASFWTIHLAGCRDAEVGSVRVLNPLDTANCDGIDIDHCREVRVHDCHVVCADDCICLKNTLGNREYPGTRDVLVTGCTLTSTSSAVKIGTEGVADFKNVIVSDCVITDSHRGVSIQVRDGGSVEDVLFSRLMIGTRCFSPHYWGSGEPIAITARDRDHAVPCGEIRHIRFSHVYCRGENGALIWADRPGRIRDIVFEDVEIRRELTSKWPKDRYDLRPGADEPGVVETKSVPIFTHNASVRCEAFVSSGFEEE